MLQGLMSLLGPLNPHMWLAIELSNSKGTAVNDPRSRLQSLRHKTTRTVQSNYPLQWGMQQAQVLCLCFV